MEIPLKINQPSNLPGFGLEFTSPRGEDQVLQGPGHPWGGNNPLRRFLKSRGRGWVEPDEEPAGRHPVRHTRCRGRAPARPSCRAPPQWRGLCLRLQTRFLGPVLHVVRVTGPHLASYRSTGRLAGVRGLGGGISRGLAPAPRPHQLSEPSSPHGGLASSGDGGCQAGPMPSRCADGETEV